MHLKFYAYWLGHKDFVDFYLSCFLFDEEAFLTHCTKIGDEYLIDLISFESDLLQVLALNLEVKHIGYELIINLYVASHSYGQWIVGVVWEAEAVVQQEKLVASIPVAVVDLLARLDCFPVFIDLHEIAFIILLSHCFKPLELLSWLPTWIILVGICS